MHWEQEWDFQISFSPFWYELEVKATYLDKAHCLDSITSYYSLLRTRALPQGCLSLSLCRTTATRGCWGTRTEPSHASLDSGCQQLRDTLSWLWPLERHQQAFLTSFWTYHFIYPQFCTKELTAGLNTLQKFIFWFQLAACWFHWMLVLPWTVRNRKYPFSNLFWPTWHCIYLKCAQCHHPSLLHNEEPQSLPGRSAAPQMSSIQTFVSKSGSWPLWKSPARLW